MESFDLSAEYSAIRQNAENYEVPHEDDFCDKEPNELLEEHKHRWRKVTVKNLDDRFLLGILFNDHHVGRGGMGDTAMPALEGLSLRLKHVEEDRAPLPRGDPNSTCSAWLELRLHTLVEFVMALPQRCPALQHLELRVDLIDIRLVPSLVRAFGTIFVVPPKHDLEERCKRVEAHERFIEWQRTFMKSLIEKGGDEPLYTGSLRKAWFRIVKEGDGIGLKEVDAGVDSLDWDSPLPRYRAIARLPVSPRCPPSLPLSAPILFSLTMAMISSISMSPLVQVALITVTTWVFWRGLRRWLTKSPLDNIPGPANSSWLVGHFEQLWDVKNGWAFHKNIADSYGSVIRLGGPFGKKTLYVYDAKALHHILVKVSSSITSSTRDQLILVFPKELYTFEESPGFTIGADVSLGRGLLATSGAMHRRQRKMLNPVFSISHMREMIPIFYDVAEKVGDTFCNMIHNGPCEIDVTHWMARLALELIGQSGMGYSFDSLTEDAEEHPYCKAVKMYIPVTNQMMTSRFYLLPWIHKLNLPPRFLRWLVDIVPWKNLHAIRDIVNVMHNTALGIVESKKRAIELGDDDSLAKQVGRGKDVMSILTKANMEADDADKLPDEEVVGQVNTLTFAATDSTSSALSRILHVLCERQDMQQALRHEIREAQKENGKRLSYDTISQLPLLDAVCRETLRLYPPVSIVLRETIADAVLPFSKPVIGVDGKEMTEVLVPKGTMVFPGILASNRNPDIWGPTANEWMPERWLEGLPDSVASAKVPGIYSHLMTFLGGGRACIGFKFSQLEIKVVLCVLLDSFKFEVPPDKHIIWRMSALVTPSVDWNSKPQLPLIATMNLMVVSADHTPSHFHDFPEDIIRLIFTIAAASVDKPTEHLCGRASQYPWCLALVSREVKALVEPLLYQIIYISDTTRGSALNRVLLLSRTISDHPTKSTDFFALHVKQLIFERSMALSSIAIAVSIAKACTGIRALTMYCVDMWHVVFPFLGNSWVKGLTRLEITFADITGDSQWMKHIFTQLESLTRMRLSFTETSQPSYQALAPVAQDLIRHTPESLRVFGVTLFLHTPIGQDELVEVVKEIIRVDVRVVVALWPTGPVDESVRRLSVVRNRTFQWHKNDEFWDEAEAEVRARQSGLRKVRFFSAVLEDPEEYSLFVLKWPPEATVATFDNTMIDGWRSHSIHSWSDVPSLGSFP
ncbi:hypothetical protein NMY22_g9670 [Coprinellus aureogranulatus]|nr:hypothetical protein NMY22_g9670 [Coprinellus aureogranulatus]